ncbi:hypothetical protein H696_04058 [Fonticula alba]|uniref:Superoxide dismutase copper/zinc binding domain-containing protein n=1 Tax=Fonticula alba TaxID=691883 RepID=A0A058Z7Z1_FONAL|nr:hypothetical protein H696_04058 [Fonticula alba]KCV69642.1 hypothetical protein H696_04058 [Fonticula alba]|eukprot:XP_009496207.1 hypothetical protein H696_04058 [Fonticula alba]
MPHDAGYPIGRGIIVTKSIDECRSVNLANTFREPETNVLAYGVFGHTTLTNPAEYTPLDKTKYPVSKAVATFVTSITHGPRDYAVSGFATFVEAKNNSVDVDVRLAGLEPEAWYSLHIHRWSYYLNDLDYAYGHYNPTGAAHGCLDSAERHAGDFGAFQADAQGRIHTQFNAPGISVHSAPSSSFLLGRSLILHYGKDDCVTNPAGNSGPRVGGAPIGVMNPDPRLNAGSSLSAPTALIGSVAVLLGLLLSAF